LKLIFTPTEPNWTVSRRYAGSDLARRTRLHHALFTRRFWKFYLSPNIFRSKSSSISRFPVRRLLTRGKNDINRLFRLLGHQFVHLRVIIMFNLGFSVHALFEVNRLRTPFTTVYDWQTTTDWLKMSKLKMLCKQRHLLLGCPWG